MVEDTVLLVGLAVLGFAGTVAGTRVRRNARTDPVFDSAEQTRASGLAIAVIGAATVALALAAFVAPATGWGLPLFVGYVVACLLGTAPAFRVWLARPGRLD